MVFENVFASLLNTYLGTFIDDVSAKQLKLGAFKGRLELKNLSIKENAFDSLDLPFKIIHGKVGILSANIPFTSLYTSPVILTLKDITVLAVPNVVSAYDPEKEAKQTKLAKETLLASIEETTKIKESAGGMKTDEDFVTKLAAQVVKNVQIRVTNVHICYEDKFTNPRKPFSVGLTLERIVFETQKQMHTQTAKVSKNADDMIYKLVSLEKFSLYWNVSNPFRAPTEFISYQDVSLGEDLLLDSIATNSKTPPYLRYILEPITFTANAIIHRRPEQDDYQIPLLYLGMILDSFSLQFTRTQFDLLMQLLDSLDRMHRAIPFRKWRPSSPIKGHARAWWKFAINSQLEGVIRPKNKVWSWSYIKKHRETLKKYQAAYVNKLTYPKNQYYADLVNELEDELDVFNINLARRQAEADVRKKQPVAAETKKKGGWFSWAWGGSKDESDEAMPEVMKELQSEITPAEKDKFYQAIGYGESASISEYPSNFAAHLLNTDLESIKLTIIDDVKGQQLVDMSLNKVSGDIRFRPSSGGLIINSSISKISIFGYDKRQLLRAESDGHILTATLEVNLQEKEYDYGVDMKAKSLRFIYDPTTLEALVEMFSPPADISLKELEQIAEIKMTEWKKISASGLEYAISLRKNIMVDIDFEPSMLVVPGGNIWDTEGHCDALILCLGHGRFRSDLQKSCVTVREMAQVETEEQMLEKLRDSATENYQLSVTNVQALLTDNRRFFEYMKRVRLGEVVPSFLQPVNLDVYLQRPLAVEGYVASANDANKMSIFLSPIKLNISPNMVQTIVSIVTAIGPEAKSEMQRRGTVAKVSATELFTPVDIQKEKFWFLKKEVCDAVEVTESTVLDSPVESPTGAAPITDLVTFVMKEVIIVIESGGIASQPMLKFETSVEGRLENWTRLSLRNTLLMNYYNEKVIAWEPMIEPIELKRSTYSIEYIPWSCAFGATLNFNQDVNQVVATMESKDQLELTMTKTCLDVLTRLGESFTNAVKDADQLSRSATSVIVRNFIGLDIVVFIDTKKYEVTENLTNQRVGDYEGVLLKDGTSMQLIQSAKLLADEDSDANFLVNIIIDGTEFMRTVSLSRQCQRAYDIPIAKYPTTKLSWIVNVTTLDIKTKQVTFGTLVQIENNLSIPVDLFSLVQSDKVSFLKTLKPTSTWYVPLKMVYSQFPAILFKPHSGEHCLPNKGVTWDLVDHQTDTKKYTFMCDPKDQSQLPFYLQVISQPTAMLFEDTSNSSVIAHRVLINTPLSVQNMLPLPISYCVSNEDEAHFLNSGQVSELSSFDPSGCILELRIDNYLGQNWVGRKKVNIKALDEEEIITIWPFKLADGFDPKNSRKLNLVTDSNIVHIAVGFSRSSNQSVTAKVFAPFWFVNKTGRELTYKVSNDVHITQDANDSFPLLFSFKTGQSSKKKICLAIDDSSWSDSFSIDTVGNQGNAICKAKEQAGCKTSYCASIDISLSSFNLTKIVTVRPFYVFVNRTHGVLSISEDEFNWVEVEAHAKQSLWPRNSEKCTLYVRNSDSYTSPVISYKTPCQSLIHLGDDLFSFLVDVNESEVKIQLSEYYPGSAPARVFNLTSSVLKYEQKGTGFISHLQPLHASYFTWAEPSGRQEVILHVPGGSEKAIFIYQDAFGEVIEKELYWVSFLDGKQRCLVITPDPDMAAYALQMNEFSRPMMTFDLCMKGFGFSLVNDELKKELVYMGIAASDIIWELRKAGSKRYKSLSVKMCDVIEAFYQREVEKRKNDATGPNFGPKIITLSDGIKLDIQELARIVMLEPQRGTLRRMSAPGLWATVSLSDHVTQLHAKMNRIQIDNQMEGCLFPIIMCPVMPPKSVVKDSAPKAFVEFSTVLQRTAGVNRIKYLSVLIQEFLVQIDGQFLMALVEFAGAHAIKTYGDDSTLIRNDLDTVMKKEEYVGTDEVILQKMFFDLIHFSPIKVHVSFSLGGVSSWEIFGVFDILLKSAGVTLTEFKNVLFKIDYYERKNVLLSNEELIGDASGHYVRQVLKQFYLIVLGLDVIGNPVGLAMGLTQGVGDLFYEPFMGIIEGPEEFAEGLALGVRSLFSSTVGGAAGALSKITGTLGEGVSALTMDDDYIKKRRARLNQDKTNVAASGKALAKGFLSGITGLVTKPFQGARDEGLEGLVKGIGKGAVGVVVQPVSGAIDFASGSFGALQKIVDINAEAKKQRPPRAFSPDNVLKPYNRHEAIGAEILSSIAKYGISKTDSYVAHGRLRHPGNGSGDVIFMVSSKRIIVLKMSCISKVWELDWQITYDNMAQIDLLQNVIKFTTKQNHRILGVIDDGNVKKVFFESPERANHFHEITGKTKTLGV
ncbi:Vacuolar protein sorting-associated protein 13C [Halotydeus destructor]|nr:Vacuolar protein sorting-associated protein 13C [Halotydeus destructor]